MTRSTLKDDLEWQELAETWRATEPVPLAGLAARVRRRNRHAAAILAIDSAISAVALGVLGWLLTTGPSPLWLVWIAFMAITTVALLAFSFRARAGTWRADGSGNAGLLELSRRQVLASIRLARGGILATLLVLAFTAGWASLEAWQLHEPTFAELRWRALVYGGATLWGIGWLVGCRFWIRRKRAEMAWLDSAGAELDRTDRERPPRA